MKTRRVAIGAVMAAALLASPYARAATTNEVDIAALVVASGAGLSETNGWTVSSKLDSYTDASLRFNEWIDWIVSPDYGDPILRIEAKVRSSAREPTRWLCVFDAKTDANVGGFAASSSEGTQADRLVDFSERRPLVSQAKLMLDPSGSGSTAWGVGSLKVITTHPISEPSNLCVSRKGGNRCELLWENGEGTVSNRVDTVLVERSEEGETVLLSTGFDNFSAGGNPEPKTNELAKIDAALSGLRIYSPANTTGVCQIATGTMSGYLRHSGFADYSGISLKLVLKQYSGDSDGTQIAYETNDVIEVFGDRLPLPSEFEERIVDLSGVPRGAAILIGYDTVASKRRVLIDSLEFVRKGTETKTVVDSRWIPATQGAASFSTRDHEIGLVPKSEYRFEVRAQNADGLISDPSAVDVVLDSPPGFRFILR